MNSPTVVQVQDGESRCLQVEGLSVSFGELHVLVEVGLIVQRGERRGVIGPNGAGKTTFFNTLAGLIRPASGTIRLFDEDITKMPAFRRAARGVARTFQRTKLFPGLSVMDNLLLSAQALSRVRYQPFKARARYGYLRDSAMDQLRRFDLESQAERVVSSMGHGEQRQIEILMALTQSPRLLLLDEPMAGLAAADSHIVTEMLAALDDSVTIIMIEHDMEVVFEVCEKLMVLHAGAVVADGTVEEVRANAMVQEVYLGGQV